MGPGAASARNRKGAGGRIAVCALALIALACLGLGPVASRAEAGKKSLAKRATKKKIKRRGGQPVKISCRPQGKHGRDGIKCHWVYAKLAASTTTRNCRGISRLRRKRGRLRFKTEGCKLDKGATSVNGLLPDKLAKQGYESTYAFCFTTLGHGYRCAWKGLKFSPGVIEDCHGGARSRDRTVTISLGGCEPNATASEAQSSLKKVLSAFGLDPGLVSCRPGGTISCSYQASKASGGWTYSCEGKASAPSPSGPFAVDPCDLHAPDEAPLTASLGAHPHFGVNEVWPFYAGKLGDLRALGADTARFTVNWAGVEQSPTSGYDWSQPDSVYTKMLARGIRPILIIQGAPCWASGDSSCVDGDFTYPPDGAHLDEWAAFARAVAFKYPQARAIEVWNEANAGLFFHGGPQPARYATLLRDAYTAIKTVAPTMPVLSSGLAPFASDGPGQQRFDSFLRGIYAQGARSHSDGIAFHAYPGSGPSGYLRAVRTQIADVKDVMLDFNDQDKPIWITETGASNAGDKPYTEAEQADAVAKLYTQFRRIPGIPTVVVHRWRDAAGSGAESGFGIERRDGSKKPVYCSLAAARGASPGGC